MEETTQEYSKLTFREILKILRDALRGTHEDYTAGSLGGYFSACSSDGTRSLFGISLCGGRHLLGLTSWCRSNCCGRTYRSNVSNPLCNGNGTLYGCNCAGGSAHRKKNPEGAAIAAVQAIALGILVSIVIALVAAPNAERLLALMGASPDVISTGSGFTRIMLPEMQTSCYCF